MATNRYDVNVHTVEQNNNRSNQCNSNNPSYYLSRGIKK